MVRLPGSDGSSRFPLYDLTGSARGLVDASGAITDTYGATALTTSQMDTFARRAGGRAVSNGGSASRARAVQADRGPRAVGGPRTAARKALRAR
jgi:hypothetical protein